MHDLGFAAMAAMLLKYGPRHDECSEVRLARVRTAKSKTVYLPVIQPDPLPLADRKKLLVKKKRR